MKWWCYNSLHRNYHVQKFLCNCSIIAFGSGGIVASIVSHGTALIAISAVSLIIRVSRYKQNRNKDIYN